MYVLRLQHLGITTHKSGCENLWPGLFEKHLDNTGLNEELKNAGFK